MFNFNSFLLSRPKTYTGSILENGHKAVLLGDIDIILEIIDTPMGLLINKKYRKEINKQILKNRDKDYNLN